MTKMTSPCSVCKGACCEYMLVNVDHLKSDHQLWFVKHGKLYTGVACRLDTVVVEVDHACRELTMGGKCRNYDGRPEICKTFKPGNPLCLEAIERQRTPEQVKLIMEATIDG